MKLARDIRKTYHQQLKTREWREFSDEQIELAGGMCSTCESDENLQVHHLVYRNVEPWEYSSEEVRVLCEDCHKAIHVVADLIWVATLRFQPGELELLLKRLQACGRGIQSFGTPESISDIVRGLCGNQLP